MRRLPILTAAGTAVLAVTVALVPGHRPAAHATTAVPAHARAFFFGDSWTGGYSADPGKGYAQVAAAGLGWTATVDASSGVGYVYAYNAWQGKFPDVAAALPATSTDVVILQGSINDVPGDLTKLPAAIDNTVSSLRWHTSQAPLVILGPAPASMPLDPKLTQIDGILRTEATKLGAPYISPISEGWINDGNVADIIDPNTVHPSTTGHAYLGARLAQALHDLQTSGKL